jgi:hypothetical protein
MPAQAAQPVDYHALAAKHGSLGSIYEGSNVTIPPAVQRIQSAIGVQYKQGKPLPDGAIASVGEHEPKIVEINDVKKFAQGPEQTASHELTHIWQNNLPPKIQAAIPSDPSKAKYDISNVDQLRAQGKTLSTIPREQAATIIQTWVADPSQRKRLQPWLDDMVSTPLSVMMPTSPDAKTINRQVRPPIPPPEAYTPIQKLVAEAKARKPKQ